MAGHVSGYARGAARPVRRDRQPDPVLRRLPAAFWRALPVLLASGCALLVPTLLVGALFGPDSPVLALVVCAVGAPLLLVCVERLHAELFERQEQAARPSWWRRARRAEAIVLPCGLAAALSLIAAYAAAQTGSAMFSVAAAVGALAALVLALLAIVALPLAAARPESTLRATLLVACYALLRSPLPALAVAAVGGALAWLGSSGLPGLTAIAPGLLAALAVGAAWPTVVRVGVDLPPLAPFSPRGGGAPLAEHSSSNPQQRSTP
ncbi:MAG: hypothetical protein R2732_02010 [Microbacteriaceae bacterium]